MIAGGITALAPVISRVSKPLSRLVSFLGFFIGAVILAVTADLTLNLNLLPFTTPEASSLVAKSPWLQYFVPFMIILGTLLFARPIRNLRWAALMSMGIGVLAAYLVKSLLAVQSTLILGVVFLIITVLMFATLKFVEDLFEFIGTVLSLPPVAISIGLVGVYFGILTLGA